jgi:hypothetical protein
MPTDPCRREQARAIELWIARVRLVAVPFAVLEVGVLSEDYPAGYERLAWLATGVFALGAVMLFVAAKNAYAPAVGVTALLFDACVIAAFATLYSYEYGSPTRWALMFVVAEGALRYGVLGATAVSLVLLPFLVFVEWWRGHEFGGPSFVFDRVSFPFGILLITGLIVGWLVQRLRHEATVA